MKTALVGVAALLLAVSTASAEVRVTMHDGRVSVIARDATIRQILTEWARVGHTKIVNVERVPGGPITLELVDVPEAQALDVLLRTLSGYIAAPRAVETADLSRFDRIIVMPTLAAARPATTAPAPPVFQHAPQFNNQQPPDDEDDNGKPVTNAPPPPARGPVFNTFPQPQVATPPQAQQQPQLGQPGGAPVMPQAPAPGMPTASPTPTAPFGGVAVPGMVAPTPPQPGAPGQIRRPGGPGGL